MSTFILDLEKKKKKKRNPCLLWNTAEKISIF